MFMTFYNVDMEKAKNINDLLEEYERMEAIIDLFFKKDVENQELEELRSGMLPSYRTMKYKSPIWGYFHVQKE